jgi:hypothetical protein
MTILSEELSLRVFDIQSREACDRWIADVDKQVGGLAWKPVGGIENNVHAIEVASDPAAALVERVTNAIDAVLDLEACSRGETAPSPHEAATAWYGLPSAGLSELDRKRRQELANLIRVTNHESGDPHRPTVTVQDAGSGQHPDNYEGTLLSLMASNKKAKTHQMGVYNAGGAATYAFAPYTIIVSRCAPALLGDKSDEIGVAVVRYDPLDPVKYKSGTYLFCADKDGQVLRLKLPGGKLPVLPHGTYVKHIEYDLSTYGRAAHEPKKSLHHLCNASLPDPALPFWIEETRVDRFKGVRAGGERRTVAGLVARLRAKDTAVLYDDRPIELGEGKGRVVLRYFVLAPEGDPDAYTSTKQGLSLVLNGQRQGTKDRYWLKRNTSFDFIWKRLIVLVDCNGLTNAAKREVFASTRESSKESALSRQIHDRVIEELKQDDDLVALDEQERQRTLDAATKATSEKIKKRLADRMAAFLHGPSKGKKGGGRGTKKRPPGPRPEPHDVDDSDLPEVPTTLDIANSPIVLRPGKTAPLFITLNAKNGFLPAHAAALSVVVGAPLNEHVRVRATGTLRGGRARITLEADKDAPIGEASLIVTLVESALGVGLMASGSVKVREPKADDDESPSGGSADIEITWIDRVQWEKFVPTWDERTVGECHVKRDDATGEITRADFFLNRAFQPFEEIVLKKRLSAEQLKNFEEQYLYPVCWGLFAQIVAEQKIEHQADVGETSVEIPDDYVREERARLGRSVLMALEPDISAAVLAAAV